MPAENDTLCGCCFSHLDKRILHVSARLPHYSHLVVQRYVGHEPISSHVGNRCQHSPRYAPLQRRVQSGGVHPGSIKRNANKRTGERAIQNRGQKGEASGDVLTSLRATYSISEGSKVSERDRAYVPYEILPKRNKIPLQHLGSSLKTSANLSQLICSVFLVFVFFILSGRQSTHLPSSLNPDDLASATSANASSQEPLATAAFTLSTKSRNPWPLPLLLLPRLAPLPPRPLPLINDTPAARAPPRPRPHPGPRPRALLLSCTRGTAP